MNEWKKHSTFQVDKGAINPRVRKTDDNIDKQQKLAPQRWTDKQKS